MDVGVTVGVVERDDRIFQFLFEPDADVSTSWIERGVRCPALSADRA